MNEAPAVTSRLIGSGSVWCWSPGFSRLKPGLQPKAKMKLTHYQLVRACKFPQWDRPSGVSLNPIHLRSNAIHSGSVTRSPSKIPGRG